MRRSFVVALIAMTVAGCGGGATAPGEPVAAPTVEEQPTVEPTESSAADAEPAGELVVQEVGYGISAAGDITFLTPVALIRNDTDKIASINVSFAAYGPGDEVLAQTETSAPVARAGATVATTTVLEVPPGSTVERVDATANMLMSDVDTSPESAFTTAEATYRPDQYVKNTGSVTGKVTSAYTQSVNDVYVVAVCRNAAGAIVGGGEDYTNIPTGQTVPVEVTSVATREIPATCELHATLGGASQAVE